MLRTDATMLPDGEILSTSTIPKTFPVEPCSRPPAKNTTDRESNDAAAMAKRATDKLTGDTDQDKVWELKMSIRLLATVVKPPANSANSAVEGAGSEIVAAESQERATDRHSCVHESVDAE